MTHANENNSTNIAVTLGNELRKQREKKKLSIGEVSERLKLPARQIEALENGEYENLPEPVFIRGFLRSYGRFLDLDEIILDEALREISPPAKVNKVSGSQNFNLQQNKEKKSFPTWIFGLIAVGAIGYGVYAWQSKTQADHAKQEQSAAQGNSNVTAPVTPPALNNANVIVQPMTASDTQTVTASGVNAASGVQAASTASASAPSVAGELVINPRYRTMLTVTNAQGEVLINKIIPAHSEQHFANGAPFEVRIGYAIGTTATFNGNAINIDAARKGGKTAVFTAQ